MKWSAKWEENTNASKQKQTYLIVSWCNLLLLIYIEAFISLKYTRIKQKSETVNYRMHKAQVEHNTTRTILHDCERHPRQDLSYKIGAECHSMYKISRCW